MIDIDACLKEIEGLEARIRAYKEQIEALKVENEYLREALQAGRTDWQLQQHRERIAVKGALELENETLRAKLTAVEERYESEKGHHKETIDVRYRLHAVCDERWEQIQALETKLTEAQAVIDRQRLFAKAAERASALAYKDYELHRTAAKVWKAAAIHHRNMDNYWSKEQLNSAEAIGDINHWIRSVYDPYWIYTGPDSLLPKLKDINAETHRWSGARPNLSNGPKQNEELRKFVERSSWMDKKYDPGSEPGGGVLP